MSGDVRQGPGRQGGWQRCVRQIQSVKIVVCEMCLSGMEKIAMMPCGKNIQSWEVSFYPAYTVHHDQ